MTDAPWTFGEARDACRNASAQQQAAEKALIDAARDYARSEENYRRALAIAIVTVHDAGAAWTVAPDLARGDDTVAKLRRERDIAEGVREAMVQAAWRRAADRKDAQRFADWSQRRELAEGGVATEPEHMPVMGGRRVA